MTDPKNYPIYAIHPSRIRSWDGDRHYISYATLIELYCLDSKQCINFEIENNRVGWGDHKFKHIYPNPSGQYPIFERIQ